MILSHQVAWDCSPKLATLRAEAERYTPYKVDINGQKLVFWTDDHGDEHEWPMPENFQPAKDQEVTLGSGDTKRVSDLLMCTAYLTDGRVGTILTRVGSSPLFFLRFTDGDWGKVHHEHLSLTPWTECK